jgi:hypothetical protein
VLNQLTGIDQLTIDATGDTGFGKARPNIGGNIHDGDGTVELTLTTIGKSNNRHDSFLVQW